MRDKIRPRVLASHEQAQRAEASPIESRQFSPMPIPHLGLMARSRLSNPPCARGLQDLDASPGLICGARRQPFFSSPRHPRRCAREPPPLKSSHSDYDFWPEQRTYNGKKETQARRDRREAASGSCSDVAGDASRRCCLRNRREWGDVF